jgi:2-oxo-4-hydroxy-4-carboxy-5-ureidoimidazoline decarboxylase
VSWQFDNFNMLPETAARAALLGCCGSSRWAREMAAARPFCAYSVMQEKADAIWRSLTRSDWLEAFAAHPQIGQSLDPRADPSVVWADQEQAGMRSAAGNIRDALAVANSEYHARFGFIFIVCASGKTGEQLLAIVEQRLQNPPDVELAIAAEEQRKITELRLNRLTAFKPGSGA